MWALCGLALGFSVLHDVAFNGVCINVFHCVFCRVTGDMCVCVV